MQRIAEHNVYANFKKHIKHIILGFCCLVAFFTALFIFTDFKIHMAIRFKLLTLMNPFEEHISSVKITDDSISVVLLYNWYIEDYSGLPQKSARTIAELNEFLYELSQKDFWNINRDVYLEAGVPDVLFGSEDSGHISAGIGNIPYDDGYLWDTGDNQLQGTWMCFESYHSEEDKKVFMEILEKYNFEKEYCPN